MSGNLRDQLGCLQEQAELATHSNRHVGYMHSGFLTMISECLRDQLGCLQVQAELATHCFRVGSIVCVLCIQVFRQPSLRIRVTNCVECRCRRS